MKIFYGFDNLPTFRHPAVTVGSYDGVHGGHAVLLSAVRELAREHGGESIVVTFAPHPRIVLESPVTLHILTTPEEKACLLERAGIDNLIFVPFTREFSRTDSREFVRRDLEVGGNAVSVRHEGADKGSMSVEQFIDYIKSAIADELKN